MEPLELWGGIEATINRVHDNFYDQCAWNGHYDRLEDLDRIAKLNIKAIRYPALWERWGDEEDWSWLDRRLERLRELGIRPILGLVHHGSGPRYTNLLDPRFATGLARYARRVAERYPWVKDYTPVNEPLTTARFSALYGHWYPHARSPEAFAQALFTEVQATVLAMRAVREIQPEARLIQTEDLGRTTVSDPKIQYQARFENERRWVTFDLLCGKVTHTKPMGKYFVRKARVARQQLDWFLENTCPPDILGVNHYVTSERFQDTDLSRHAPHTHGGNGRHRYADTEAVWWKRAMGPLHLLMECWERFQMPMAITEAHLGSTREEQLRWLVDVWDWASQARNQGADIRAVTNWSLLGSFDWNKLLTNPVGFYESGAYDVRSNPPRPTAVAHLVAELGAGRKPAHPVLDSPGFWKHDRVVGGRVILITGGPGKMAQACAKICQRRGLAHRVTSRQELDIANRESVQNALSGMAPWAVVNCAGYRHIDEAEKDIERCMRENVRGSKVLAQECERRGIPLLTFSTDLVFGGDLDRPYQESDAAVPLGVLGRSKHDAEQLVLGTHPGALVVRTAPCFGPWDEHNMPVSVLRELSRGKVYRACTDAIVSPTNVCHLIDSSLDLLVDGETGIWHLANRGNVSWFELARSVAELAGLDAQRIEPATAAELGWVAPRPAYSALTSERGNLLPNLDSALECFLRDCEIDWRQPVGRRI
jgi:dTDP-4-dehydrorhamnose reductase